MDDKIREQFEEHYRDRVRSTVEDIAYRARELLHETELKIARLEAGQDWAEIAKDLEPVLRNASANLIYEQGRLLGTTVDYARDLRKLSEPTPG